MSHKLVQAVFKTNLRLSLKMVALCLAEHADEETRKAWPGLDTIQAQCDLSRRYVLSALETLVDLKLITRRFEGKKSVVTTFASRNDAVWKSDFKATEKLLVNRKKKSGGTMRMATPKGAHDDTEGCTSRHEICRHVHPNHHEPSSEPPTEPPAVPNAKPHACASDVQPHSGDKAGPDRLEAGSINDQDRPDSWPEESNVIPIRPAIQIGQSVEEALMPLSEAALRNHVEIEGAAKRLAEATDIDVKELQAQMDKISPGSDARRMKAMAIGMSRDDLKRLNADPDQALANHRAKAATFADWQEAMREAVA